MTIAQQSQFEALRAAWLEHQQLKVQGAPIADLATSRKRLDEARLHAYSAAA